MGIVGFSHNGRVCCNCCEFLCLRRSITDLTHPQYQSALEEWQNGHLIRKQFEVEHYSRTYAELEDYIIDSLKHDPHGECATERLSSWAEDRCASSHLADSLLTTIFFLSFFLTSAFVQELIEGSSIE